MVNPVKRFRPDAKYVSAGKQEYVIEQVGAYWKVSRWGGGLLNKNLNQLWTSFGDAERALIQFLKSTDRILRKSRYPGCPAPRRTNSTEPS